MKTIYDTKACRIEAAPLKAEYDVMKARLDALQAEVKTLEAEMREVARRHNAIVNGPEPASFNFHTVITHRTVFEGGLLYIKISPSEQGRAYLYAFCNQDERRYTARMLQEAGITRVLIDNRFDHEGHDIDPQQLEKLLAAPYPVCYLTMRNGWLRHPDEPTL